MLFSVSWLFVKIVSSFMCPCNFSSCKLFGFCNQKNTYFPQNRHFNEQKKGVDIYFVRGGDFENNVKNYNVVSFLTLFLKYYLDEINRYT